MSTDDSLLTTVLRAIGAEETRRGASAFVEARLRAEFRALSAEARGARARREAVRYATAAALVVAIGIPAWRLSRASRVSPAGTELARPVTGSAVIATGFLPLTYGSVPLSGGQIIRLEVPKAALSSFGLTPPDAAVPAGATVIADVVVGDDGLARAVRFVRTGP